MGVQAPGQQTPRVGNATCSGILAWELPWTEEPGGLISLKKKIQNYKYTAACVYVKVTAVVPDSAILWTEVRLSHQGSPPTCSQPDPKNGRGSSAAL